MNGFIDFKMVQTVDKEGVGRRQMHFRENLSPFVWIYGCMHAVCFPLWNGWICMLYCAKNKSWTSSVCDLNALKVALSCLRFVQTDTRNWILELTPFVHFLKSSSFSRWCEMLFFWPPQEIRDLPRQLNHWTAHPTAPTLQYLGHSFIQTRFQIVLNIYTTPSSIYLIAFPLGQKGFLEHW